MPAPEARRCRLRRSRDPTGERPAEINSESGLLRVTVFLNVRGRDMGSFVDEAKQVVREKVKLPPGYYVAWSGQ